MKRVFLLVTLSSLVFLSACVQKKADKMPDAVRAQFSYLPQNAFSYGFMDIQAIQNSDFFRAVIDSLPAMAALDSMVAQVKDTVRFDLFLIKDWISKKQNAGEAPELDKKLVNALDTLPYKQAFWLLVHTPTAAKVFDHMPVPPVKELAEKIESAFFSWKMDSHIRANSTLIATSEDNAGLMQDAVKGFIATAKLSVNKDRRLVDILNKIDVSVEEKSTRIDLSFSQQDAKQLMQAKPDLMAMTK